MAILTLIFGGPQRAQLGTMILDASENEDHARSATVTKSEIEDGSNVADHVALDPITLNLEAFISDTPVGFFKGALGAGVGFATSSVQNAFGGGGSVSGSLAGQAAALGVGSLASLVSGPRETTDGSRLIRNARDAFKYLEELYNDRQPFTVITALKRYSDMVISNLSVPRSARTGTGLGFTVMLEQVMIVSSSIIKVPPFVTDDKSASTKANLGKQANTEKEVTGPLRSTLDKLIFARPQ